MSQMDLIGGQWDAIGEYLARTGMAPIPQLCKSCRAQMWWGYTINGKRCPYNFTNGVFTNESHFATCPAAKAHSKRMHAK